MKIGLSEVELYVLVLRPLLFPSKGGWRQSWISEHKLTKLVLKVGSHFYNLASYTKSALIRKPSEQIPKAFNQHEIQQSIRYKCFKISKWLILFSDTVTNFSPKNVSHMSRGSPQSDDNKISRSLDYKFIN